MIARLAAGDDSLGSATVTVLSLLYIGLAFALGMRYVRALQKERRRSLKKTPSWKAQHLVEMQRDLKFCLDYFVFMVKCQFSALTQNFSLC